MNTEVFNQQIEDLYPDFESRILELKSRLDTTFAEDSEIIENGFSFSSSLKDISRFIVSNLVEQFNNIEHAIYVVENWQRFVNALDNPSLISEDENSIFQIFCIVYYDSIDYFKNQFLSHLGEKVEFSSEFIDDPAVLAFVEKTGFRKRKFNYVLEKEGKNSVQFVTASTSRTFEIKKSEREKVELLNSIFIRLVLKPYEADALIALTINKFPDLEPELISILQDSKQIQLLDGDSLVEVSPPFENYKYQHDCMLRVFTFNGDSFDVNQYSIPFESDEMEIATANFYSSFNATQINTSTNNQYKSNSVLGNVYVCKQKNASELLNSFPSLVDFGGSNVIEKTAELINPKIEHIGNQIHPFIVSYINSPSFGLNSIDLKKSVQKYKEVFLSSVATLDVNIQEENPYITELLSSGDLLTSVISGEDAATTLFDASGGQVTELEVSSSGYCDLVEGVIGGSNTDSKENYLDSELKDMQFMGKITSLTKEGDIKLDLVKYADQNGKEHKLFLCPVCSAKGIQNYVDICAESCPICNVSLQKMRLASEEGKLGSFVQSQYRQSNSTEGFSEGGIFGVLFDLFGALFEFF